jgi:SAM-dependent methyltransferase
MKTRESGMPEESMWQGFFEPEVLLKKLGLTSPCRSVVDFGSGYGTFTVPTARIASGIVYALDIEPEMVAQTRRKAEEACLNNVEVRQRDFVVDGSGLPDSSVDYAMLFNILHAEERMPLIQEAWRVLAAEGKLAIIHWNFDPTTPRGPSLGTRPKPEECRAWCEAVGFECQPPGRIDLPPYHYGLVFRKPVRPR